MHGSFTKQKLTFAQLLHKYTKAVPKDRALKKGPSSSPRQGKCSPRGESSKRRGDSTTLFPPQKVYATMLSASPASGFSYPTWGHEGIWMYCYPMLYPPSRHREEDRRRHAFGKVSRLVHDRLGPHRSGQRRQPAPVRTVAIDRSDRSHRRPVKVRSPRQVYRVKKKKDEVHTTVDPEKAKADDKVQICNIKVDVSVASTRLMVFDKSVNPPVQRPIMDNDHGASSSNSTSKYFQPRWCPPGLTRTQRRKLQRLRA